MKKLVGFLFICLSFVFLSWKFIITGAVVGFAEGHFPGFFILFLVFFIVGIFLLTSQRTLDAIILPTGNDFSGRLRTEKAIKTYARQKTRKIIISGRRGKKGNSQADWMYDQLRKAGIREQDIERENRSVDTIENVLYSSKKFGGAKSIGVVTYPDHFRRFKIILDHAKKEGLVNKAVHFYRISTDESWLDRIYEMGSSWELRKSLRDGLKKYLHKGKPKPGFFKKVIDC